MVLTKENVAAHAVTEHLVSLQLLSFLLTFKEKWGEWSVTTSKIAKALTLHWTFLLLTGTRFFGRNCSSLDAEVGFDKNVANPLAPLLNG